MLHNYELDKPMLLKAPVEDGVMEFSGSNEKLAGQAQQALAA